jgi:hypothetical protein
VEHSVRLDKLPDGLRFPEDLHDRITYDASRRQLVFQGFMFKATCDRLMQLSHDLEYQRAVQELFAHSTEPEHHGVDDRKAMGRILIAALIISALVGLLVGWLLMR